MNWYENSSMDFPPKGLYGAFSGADTPPTEPEPPDTVPECPYLWACKKSANRIMDGLKANGIVELLELQIENETMCSTCPLDDIIREGLELPADGDK